MKTSVFLVSGMLLAGVAFAQTEFEYVVEAPYLKNEIYNSVDDFLGINIEYPDELKSRGIEGTEIVQFTVTRKGKLTDFKVINSVSPVIDEYIIEALKITDGKWTPGKADNSPKDMETEVSVAFYMYSEEEVAKSAKNYQQKGNKYLFEKNNPEKALKFYNQGIVLLPNEESILAMRSYCKHLLGDNEGAVRDWNRLKILASRNGNSTEKYIATLNLNLDNVKIESLQIHQGIR